VFDVEAELFDLIEPSGEEAIDVLLGAQPRHSLVVGAEGEVGQDARWSWCAAAQQVMAEDSEGMHHRQQLEDVGWVGPLGSGKLTAFKGDRMMHPVVVGLR
jgi:hypothetical protein